MLVVLVSFTLALVAEWGVLSVIVRAMAPNPRVVKNSTAGSQRLIR
jgi:hypothetical protein